VVFSRGGVGSGAAAEKAVLVTTGVHGVGARNTAAAAVRPRRRRRRRRPAGRCRAHRIYAYDKFCRAPTRTGRVHHAYIILYYQRRNNFPPTLRRSAPSHTPTLSPSLSLENGSRSRRRHVVVYIYNIYILYQYIPLPLTLLIKTAGFYQNYHHHHHYQLLLPLPLLRYTRVCVYT